MPRRGVIYALLDPRTDEVRYIGMTRDLPRRMRHYRQGALRKPRTAVLKWLVSLGGLRAQVSYRVVEEVSLDVLAEREQYWTAEFRAKSDRLLNISDGGDGVTHTPEVRRKMSERAKARWADPDRRRQIIAAQNRGRQAARAARSAAEKGDEQGDG